MILVFRLFLLLLCVSAIVATYFRTDYKYKEYADGWFKLHTVPARWHEARLRCQYEGAVLASPVSKTMLFALNSIMVENAPLPCGVYTGIHATFSKGDYYTIDGVPLSQVASKWAPADPKKCFKTPDDCLIMLPDATMTDVDCGESFPFICYRKNTKDMKFNACATVDPEYKFDERSGSCHKFHREPQTWSRAFEICSAEGGHLAIINSDEEAQALKELLEKHPRNSTTSAFKDSAMLGFLNWGQYGAWTTIRGQTLQEAGYAAWSPNQPDNARHSLSKESGQHCGAMFRTGLLDDVWCDLKLAFICEKWPANLFEAGVVDT